MRGSKHILNKEEVLEEGITAKYSGASPECAYRVIEETEAESQESETASTFDTRRLREKS